MASDYSERYTLRFDSFAADLQTCELCKGDRLVKLQPQPFKLLVLLASRPGELVTREEIQQELWSNDTFVDFEHGINYSVQQIRNALGESADKPRFVQTVPRRGYRFITAVEVEGAQPMSPREETENPYPGLTAFTESDAEFFFGREEENEILKRKLERRCLSALVGASGAGKTSLLRAGLIPSLPDSWSWVWCEPGTSPLQNLARALVPQFLGDAETTQKLVSLENVEQALAVLYLWRERQEEALLIIDQFEELFTLNAPEEQSRFAELLGRAASETGVRVLVALRDDFLLLCNDHEPLAPIFESLTPLTPPKEPALRRILIEPARKQGYVFEDGDLVDAMLSEVKEERGALPLLAFAAGRMWVQRDRETKRLTWDAYREIDGVAGALARHAEAVLERIGNEQNDKVREIFRNLITAKGTRVGRSRDEILSVFGEPGRAGAVVQALVNARLLTTFETTNPEGQKTSHQIEIIHESLLKNWPRLVRWQTQDADSALVRDQLRQAARLWEERGRSNELLWTGKSFREYRVWRENYRGGLSANEESFAQAMVRQAGRRRRQRRFAVTGAFTLLLFVVGVVSFLWQRSVEQARRAEASKLLALGQLEMDRYPTESVAYALKSLELADTREGRLFALKALQKGPPALIMRDTSQGIAHIVDVTPNGQWLAMGGIDTVQLLPRDGGAPVLVAKYPTTASRAVNLKFTPRGDRLVTAKEGEIRIYSVPGGRELAVRNIESAHTKLAMGSHSFLTVSEVEGGIVVRKWPFEGGEPTVVGRMDLPGTKAGSPFGTSAVGIDPAGKWLAYGLDRQVYLRSLENWAIPPRNMGEHTKRIVPKIAFHPGSDRFATRDVSGEIRVWSVGSTSKEPVRVVQGMAGENGPLFDGSGNRLIDYGKPEGQATVELWNLDAPPEAEPLTILRGGDAVNGAVFDPRGLWLTTGNSNGGVTFWPLTPDYPLVLRGHEGSVTAVAFTPDGKRLVSGSQDGTVRVWFLEGDKPSKILLRHRDLIVPQIDIDPSGRKIFVSGHRGTVFLVPLEGGSPRLLEGFSSATVVGPVAFGPSGRLSAAASMMGPVGASVAGPKEEKVIRVWDLESLESRVLTLTEGAGESTSLSGPRPEGFLNLHFLPDGRLLSCSANGLHLSDLEHRTMNLLESGIFGCDLSPDGHRVLLEELDLENRRRRLKWMDLTAKRSRPLGQPDTRLWMTYELAFDPTGTLAISGDGDGIVRVFPASGGNPHLLFGHESGIWDVTVSPDGRWIASAGDDNTIRLWPMPDIDQRPFHTLPYEELLERLRKVTNMRVVETEATSTGYRGNDEIVPFPGWEKVPEW